MLHLQRDPTYSPNVQTRFFLGLRAAILLALLPLGSAWAIEEPKIVPVPSQLPETALSADASPWSRVLLMSWNMEWFPGQSPTKATDETRAAQTKAVAAVLRKENPAIVFGCEVRDLAALKELKLDYPYMACTDIPRTKDEGLGMPIQGLAWMSKIPWKETWTIAFNEMADVADRPPRCILGAVFALPDGASLTLYGVHLKSNRGGVEASSLRRERAVTYLVWDFKRRGIDPKKDAIILMGDFNTSYRDPSFEKDTTLKDIIALGFVMASEGMTAEQSETILPDGRYKGNDFDHFLVSEGLAKKASKPKPWLSVVTETGKTESDHHPILLPVGSLFFPAPAMTPPPAP
jgi:endonuclease/exonuclease/phosphatase family metal-dependent hydrolase